MKDHKRNYIARNKLPIVVIAIFYGALLYILNYTLVENNIHVIKDELKQKITIEVEKK